MEIQIMYLDSGAVTSTMGANLNRTYSATGDRVKLINMLHPSYNYTVSIAAATSAGIGTLSVPLTVTMPEDGRLLAKQMCMPIDTACKANTCTSVVLLLYLYSSVNLYILKM